jgi:8-oxo-dGTP pyrophosphatase MutT (NUDIX family)
MTALDPREGGQPVALDLSAQKVEFLLIQRRDSIGYVEMMRGKYKATDTKYILTQLQGMTQQERERLLTEPFESLWDALWGAPIHNGHAYRHEKEQAKTKLEALRPQLPALLAACGPAWDTPEWGFPKGRRDNETEYACAMRELWEETNLRESAILPLRNIDPLVERFCGSNQVHYEHKYYLAFAPPAAAAAVSYERALEENEHIRREVGGITWAPLEKALSLFRPDQGPKRDVLLRAASFLQTYAPLAYQLVP